MSNWRVFSLFCRTVLAMKAAQRTKRGREEVMDLSGPHLSINNGCCSATPRALKVVILRLLASLSISVASRNPSYCKEFLYHFQSIWVRRRLA
jgi:hypothetical protein